MKKIESYDFGFIGIGKMSLILLEAMLEAKLIQPERVIVSRRSLPDLKKIAKNLGVHITQDNQKVAATAKTLWLGIKPFQAIEVCRQIRPCLFKQSTVISMMAGVSIKVLRQNLGAKIPLIRLMPNTPTILGSGVVGVYFPPQTPPKTRALLLKALKPLGTIHLAAQEKQLDAITGLSGSGPAFIYEVAQGLIQGGIKSGLKRMEAESLAIETLLGAAKMLKTQNKMPAELIAQVVSKGGTTEAGLKVLRSQGFAQNLAAAVQAATQRAQTLRKELESCTPSDRS